MSNIKERVLLIAKNKGINRTEFFKELGLSYANFKGIQKTTSLNSDAIVTILSKYPDVRPEWLVTGQGEMYRDEGTVAREKEELYADPIVINENEQTLIDVLKMVISTQEKTIRSLERQISLLEEELQKPKGR